MHLSKHFTLSEFIHSDTAVLHSLDNYPDDFSIVQLCRLCSLILEPLRNHINAPIHITSGYRCSALNELVGGVGNSNHLLGLACDFKVDSTALFFKSFDFLQSLECVDELIKYPTFIHVSLKFIY